MTDQRLKTLAHNLIHYSCQVQPGENVLIEMYGGHHELVNELVKEVGKREDAPMYGCATAG
jgi:aminopeptidase